MYDEGQSISYPVNHTWCRLILFKDDLVMFTCAKLFHQVRCTYEKEINIQFLFLCVHNGRMKL